MYDNLAEFDFVCCSGILYRLYDLPLAFYGGLFICYVFFRRSLPGLLLAYSPFCSFFSFKITIRTKTGNIP